MDEPTQHEAITSQGKLIKDMKASKAAKEALAAEVATLLSLKAEYKKNFGKEYEPAAVASSEPPPAPPAKKEKVAAAGGGAPAEKEGESKQKKAKGEKKEKEAGSSSSEAKQQQPAQRFVPPAGLCLYPSPTDADANLKCWLVAASLKCQIVTELAAVPSTPRLPALTNTSEGSSVLIFGANAICRYLAEMSASPAVASASPLLEQLLDVEELELVSALSSKSTVEVERVLIEMEQAGPFEQSDPLIVALVPSLSASLELLSSSSSRFPNIATFVSSVYSSDAIKTAKFEASGGLEALDDFDWSSAGLLSSLRAIFTYAITKAFPVSRQLKINEGNIARCANVAFGDFQCNNAMALSKALKGLAGFTGPTSPKDVGEAICRCLPNNPIIANVSTAPNGFVNITVSMETLCASIVDIIDKGAQPPRMARQKVLVDFSSPNIAKEMHVGHLRSTIIGDAVCRILEFCGHEVLRVNHVGDWGTQFGMLITYLQSDFYPLERKDFPGSSVFDSPPGISELTKIYKAAKLKFDSDEVFKETSRNNVVMLQAGDEGCRAIWTLLCDISRIEFQNVYSLLKVTLEEVGESFYNPFIPAVIDELRTKGLVEDEEGMKIIKLPHFTIPLIVQKSDGGYGYDSTDMAAVNYRIKTLACDRVIYITDAGQAPHFFMVFDAAKAAGWVTHQSLEHIGFGVVAGDDGKRFKTRSSETVKLVDLLIEAKTRMKEALEQRAAEGHTQLQGEELDAAAAVIGFGAVKYFDLKGNPSTNYIFSFDKMLDTKGDTAVYLLFAYARLASILRKASDERGVSIEGLRQQGPLLPRVNVDHPAERALAFELLNLGDVIKSVLSELLPNRLCDYLKDLSVKFTDFVTKCQVLNSEEIVSRLLLCEATRKVMQLCFGLLGIGTLERI